MSVRTNIVDKKALRNVQLETLKKISDTISASFGPMGSNTLMIRDNAKNEYSKDGYTILQSMKFLGTIEEAVRTDLVDILRDVIKEFGDNSTSATILTYKLFEYIVENEDEIGDNPYTIIRKFKEAVKNINAEIMKRARECTVDDIYNIAYVSTNGNAELASVVKSIYEQYSMGVYVDVNTSTTKDFIIKELDGLTLKSGYMDACFINNTAKNIASIRDAHIYYFEDPIDTPEMGGFVDMIIGKNIIEPINNHQAPVPTVILAPNFSRDYSTTIKDIVTFMHNSPTENKVPLLMVTNIYDTSILSDITHLAGCPTIKKYIDPNVQKADIERGIAPDNTTITDFCGHAELVEASMDETKFVNPAKMYITDEDGNRVEAPEYKALIQFLESEITRQRAQAGPNTNEISLLKKRLNALKCNMVELYVGGIAPAERNSAKDLIEDAILNCRSAAEYGYGYGANYEGLVASKKMFESTSEDDPLYEYYRLIYYAYYDISVQLYETVYKHQAALDYVDESLKVGFPLNLRTDQFDGQVVSSIRSDAVALDAISRIMTIMVTCNQAFVQNPVVNNYEVQ